MELRIIIISIISGDLRERRLCAYLMMTNDLTLASSQIMA